MLGTCHNCGALFDKVGSYPFCGKLPCTIAAARMMGVEITIERTDGGAG